MGNFIQPILNEIELEIPDLVIDNSRFKRKAKLHSMVYNLEHKQLVLNWVVSFYATTSEGGYGENLNGLIPSYTRENIADNTTMVNPLTGEILQPDENGEYIGDYMGQYDWFNQLGENVPVNVHSLIRQYGQGITNWDKKR